MYTKAVHVLECTAVFHAVNICTQSIWILVKDSEKPLVFFSGDFITGPCVVCVVLSESLCDRGLPLVVLITNLADFGLKPFTYVTAL